MTFPESPVPSDARLWPGELPFTAFGQFGVDKLDMRVFDQDIYWVDRFGQPHLIDDMDEDYRENVVRFLYASAVSLHTDMVVRLAGQAAGDALMGNADDAQFGVLVATAVVTCDPTEWLDSTTLMRRLRRFE